MMAAGGFPAGFRGAISVEARLERSIFRMLSKGGAFAESDYPALTAAARRARRTLMEHLVAEGRVSEKDISVCTAESCGLEFEEIDLDTLAPELAREVPPALAVRNRVIPVRVQDGTLYVAAAEPLSPSVLENLRRVSSKRVVVHITAGSTISEGMRVLYGHAAAEGRDATAADDDTDGSSAVQLLAGLLSDAAGQQASDVHIEPEESRLRIRFRVDGLLREHASLPKAAAASLVSRIKVLARLNIAEKRSPQDGSFSFDYNGETIDLRVSTLPSLHGEKTVVRLLASKSRKITLEKLGMEPDALETFRRLITRPHGIILITGPTGSGKSTTLYAALQMVKSPTVNITTVEDPVEYQIEGVTQVQVDNAEKITFAKALRALLRQDPDVIMVGEVRDRETADIALRAALTGHLVFSTLHTNDAPGALTRLVDMGCEPYLVSSSVCAVVAQRLLRVNCPACSEPFTPTPDLVKRTGLADPDKPRTWYRGRGCPKCHRSGYTGRLGTFELLEIDDDIRGKIVTHAPADHIRNLAIAKGMRTLREDSFLKVERGQTTPEELLRVTTED